MYPFGQSATFWKYHFSTAWKRGVSHVKRGVNGTVKRRIGRCSAWRSVVRKMSLHYWWGKKKSTSKSYLLRCVALKSLGVTKIADRRGARFLEGEALETMEVQRGNVIQSRESRDIAMERVFSKELFWPDLMQNLSDSSSSHLSGVPLEQKF